MILLASQSPRRKKILKFIGVPFRVVKTKSILEERKGNESPWKMVRRLAYQKARAASKRFPRHWVLGADTVVVCGRQIFGKPRSPEKAASMLRNLQKRPHEVWTGVALIGPGGRKKRLHSEKTKVLFRNLSIQEMDRYLKTKEPYDKAGGYDIQGTARRWIVKWEGDYFNIMGLPVVWLISEINRLGLDHG